MRAASATWIRFSQPSAGASMGRPACRSVAGNAAGAIDAGETQDDRAAAERMTAENLLGGKGSFSSFAGRLGWSFFVDPVAFCRAVNSGRTDVNQATL